MPSSRPPSGEGCVLPPPLFCLCLTWRCCCVSTHAVGSEVVLLLAAPRQLLLPLPLVTHGCLVTSNRLGSLTPASVCSEFVEPLAVAHFNVEGTIEVGCCCRASKQTLPLVSEREQRQCRPSRWGAAAAALQNNPTTACSHHWLSITAARAQPALRLVVGWLHPCCAWRPCRLSLAVALAPPPNLASRQLGSAAPLWPPAAVLFLLFCARHGASNSPPKSFRPSTEQCASLLSPCCSSPPCCLCPAWRPSTRTGRWARVATSGCTSSACSSPVGCVLRSCTSSWGLHRGLRGSDEVICC